MTYKETLNYLFNQLPAFEKTGISGYKPGLDNVEKLSALFGSPQKSIKRMIHVAGTNGKGSTSHTLAAILQSAGYKVGLFTSPHLLDFRERIRVNGQMIPESAVIDFIRRYTNKRSELKPTFFELTTIMALEYFFKENVDIAVIEVGLGGRLDSTNIITPILSIITNISLDHTDLLGDTPAQIAKEKAGIIKEGIPVVIGECDCPEVRSVFVEKSKGMQSPIRFADETTDIESIEKTPDGYIYHTSNYGRLHGELTGDYQPKNTATVLAAVDILQQTGLIITTKDIDRGLSNVRELTGLSGRWMRVNESPIAICDTGHNPGGWAYLCGQINSLPGIKHIIIGFVADKDVNLIIGMTHDQISDARYYFTAPECKRRLAPEDLNCIAGQYGLTGYVTDSVTDAYKKALAEAGKDDSIFIGGSNYVVSELLDYLRTADTPTAESF